MERTLTTVKEVKPVEKLFHSKSGKLYKRMSRALSYIHAPLQGYVHTSCPNTVIEYDSLWVITSTHFFSKYSHQYLSAVPVGEYKVLVYLEYPMSERNTILCRAKTNLVSRDRSQ